MSPLSSNGVMVLANAQVPDRNKFQRTQFKYTGYVVLVAPILAWPLVVLPTSAYHLGRHGRALRVDEDLRVRLGVAQRLKRGVDAVEADGAGDQR